MSNNENLTDKEGVKKIKELAKDITTCMFCTQVDNLPFKTRPMATADVDDEGNIWFFSSTASDKNDEIKNDELVQLIYVKNSDNHFMTVTGKAQTIKDRHKIDELWNSMVKAWFPEGKDDSHISLLKIVPQDAYYWDTKNGKMITLLKIAASVVTGNKADVGVQGKIKV